MPIIITLLFNLFGGNIWLPQATAIECMLFVIVCIEVIYHCVPIVMKLIRWFYKTFKSGCIKFNVWKEGDK